MVFALVVTFVAIALAFGLAEKRRIHPAVVALVAQGITAGAVIGSIPGAFALIGLTVVAATGPASGINWTMWTTLAALGTLGGIAIGAGCAGSLADRHVGSIARRAASAAAFAIGGVAISAAIIWASSSASGGSDHLLWSLPLLVVATSTLGFVVPRGRGR